MLLYIVPNLFIDMSDLEELWHSWLHQVTRYRSGMQALQGD